MILSYVPIGDLHRQNVILLQLLHILWNDQYYITLYHFLYMLHQHKISML